MTDNKDEIKAVARAIYPQYSKFDDRHKAHAADVIAALDRVRDARGDDELGCAECRVRGYCDCKGLVRKLDEAMRGIPSHTVIYDRVKRVRDELARSPQGEELPPCDYMQTPCPARTAAVARSPQGEDHEAGIEAMLRVGPWRGLDDAERASAYRHNQAKEAIAAYLSRVSPQDEGHEAIELIAQGLWNRHRQTLPGKGVGMEPPWGDVESGQTRRFYEHARSLVAHLLQKEQQT